MPRLRSALAVAALIAGSVIVTVTYTAPGGSCVAGAGACIDSISDSTPAVDQTITLLGQDFHQQVTAGWNAFLTADMRRFSFEGTSGDQTTTLGWLEGGKGGTIDSAQKVLGNASVRYRTAVTKPDCVGRGGVDAAYSYFINPSGNVTEGFLGFYVRWNPYANWPNEYIKPLGFIPNGGWLIQPANGIGSRSNPRDFQYFSNGRPNGGVHATFAFSPDRGRVLSNRWYYVDLHFKNTATTDFTMRVNGQEVVSFRPPVTDSVNNLFMAPGIINACGTATWGLDEWFDAFVYSTSQVYAPSEVWLCPAAGETDMARCVWQFPETVSDTSNVFIFRKTGGRVKIPAGTAYVKVRNQERELSAGIAVTVP
jgi:hypothetical protein